jgi:AraC family transcriptional regulator of arabinose operon
MYLREGFPGQRLHVLPAPLISEALRRPPTTRLLITDAGYFPHAAMHGRVRRNGAGQTILILCADGAGWCEVAGQRHEVRAGQLLLIPARTAHRYYADTSDPWSIWWLHVTGADVADLVQAIGLTVGDPVASLIDPLAAFALVGSICDSLARDETWASLIAAAGTGWSLLARLAAERQRRSGDTEPLQLVQDHLREHLTSSIRLSELAELAGFSTSHFSARFRAFTGYSVLEYVKRLRMARARQLLITSDRTIAEIAVAVGYPDPFYFSRLFHSVNEISPSAFRARERDEAHQPAASV